MTEEPAATRMTPQEQRAVLKQFFNALRDRPLSPGDSFYVPYLEERPEEDHISFLASEIRMSEAAGVILLSGHRGAGKSTELRRLKHYLEESDCVVLLSDMQDYMNMTTRVELTDFFISAMGALAEAQAAAGSAPSRRPREPPRRPLAGTRRTAAGGAAHAAPG